MFIENNLIYHNRSTFCACVYSALYYLLTHLHHVHIHKEFTRPHRNVSEMIFYTFITYSRSCLGKDPYPVITSQCLFTADLGVFEDFAEYDHFIQADAKGQTRDIFSNIFRVIPLYFSKESVPGFTGFKCWLLFQLV